MHLSFTHDFNYTTKTLAAYIKRQRFAIVIFDAVVLLPLPLFSTA